jgi:phosphate-selective porin OprO/OprP
MPKISRHSSPPIKKRSLFIFAVWILYGAFAYAQVPVAIQPSPIEDDPDNAATDDLVPDRRLARWNEYDGKYASIRAGGGFLIDYAAFAQDNTSKEQIAVEPKFQLRDARVLFKGKLKFIKSRSVTWSAGIMYNSPTHSWQFRQTGLNIAVPELWGSIFVGRTKEGISLNKIMVGYHGWTSERATVNDAMIPILGDGIKWMGYSEKTHLVWNLGFFGYWLSKNLAFSNYKYQTVGRLAWVKFVNPSGGRLLHVGSGFRYGVPENDKLQLRSRPEVYPSPYFLDTGTFPATNTRTWVPEAYYRAGAWMFGTEYMIQQTNAPASGNPVFHGGEWLAAWVMTGETRPYNVRCGCFDAISPRRTVFEGGRGAWELVTRFSRTDLDGGTIKGGTFWRFTPMVNWHMSDNVRLEFSYGVGRLDRFGLSGVTQFFQTRLQLSL